MARIEEAQKPEPTRGEIFEGIAFQFCKVATVTLIAGRWALPLSAGLGSLFFLLTHFSGKRDTRCFLRYPVLAGLLLFVVCVGSVWWNIRPLPTELVRNRHPLVNP